MSLEDNLQAALLPAGTELDTLVEMEVLGLRDGTQYGIRWRGAASLGPWPVVTWGNTSKDAAERQIEFYRTRGMDCELVFRRKGVLEYSQSWGDAMRVVEAMTKRGYRITLQQQPDQTWSAVFYRAFNKEPVGGVSGGEDLPHAVAVAALITVRAEAT